MSQRVLLTIWFICTLGIVILAISAAMNNEYGLTLTCGGIIFLSTWLIVRRKA